MDHYIEDTCRIRAIKLNIRTSFLNRTSFTAVYTGAINFDPRIYETITNDFLFSLETVNHS